MNEMVRSHISLDMGVSLSINLKKYLGLPNMVGRNKKASFKSLKDRIKKKVDRVPDSYHKEEMRYSLKRSFKPYQHMLCIVFYFLIHYTRRWRG